MAMHDLVREAWGLYHVARSQPYVVQPAVPILYFGDAEAYLRSKRRIITVGLNPSRAEFPRDDPFARFPAARSLLAASEASTFCEVYLQALNRYFIENPYASWFATFEPMLQGLDSSYYPGSENVALHTDLCSPLATDPTWSKLPDQEQARLERGGQELWHRLVEHLRPHFILISVAERHLQKIRFLPLSDWRTVCTLQRENPYELRYRVVQIGDSRAHLVFGKAAQKPFGTVSDAHERSMGRCLSDREQEGTL